MSARTNAPGAALSEAPAPVWAAQIFLLSLLVPFYISVGPILLMPHRILLLIFFVPFFLKLFIFRSSGPVLLADWFMFGSAIWAMLALAMNMPLGEAIEPAGIHMVEFFGAYLLARVAIRSSDDFRKVVWTFFCLLLIIVPFAAIESVTRRPVLLNLLPGTSVHPIDIGIRMNLRRAQVIFAHPILYGVFVSTGFGLFWYVLRPRGLAVMGAVLSAIGTIFSLSTGALIAVVIQSVYMGWDIVTRKVRSRWTIFAVLAALGYFAIDLLSNRTPFHVLVTYASFDTGSAYNRILIWQFGTDNVWNNPLFGLGERDWVRPGWMSGSIDNYWLLLSMRYGLPTIIMILLSLALILRRVSLAELTDPQDLRCRAGYLVAFGGLFIAGATVHYWHAMMAFVMFVYGSGLWAATGGGVQERSQDETPEDVPERLSSYTRQPASGGPIRVHGTRIRPSTALAASPQARRVKISR